MDQTIIDLTLTPQRPDPPPPPELIPPMEFFNAVPTTELPIPHLLAAKIPVVLLKAQITGTMRNSAQSCLVTTDLNYSIDEIFTNDVPHPDWIKEADEAVRLRLRRATVRGRSEANQRTHVCHPLDRNLVYPPWIVTAWRGLLPVIGARDKWRRTMQWIEDQGDSELAHAAMELIEKMKWGTAINELSSTAETVLISEFSRFASRQWLSDATFQVMTTLLNVAVPPWTAWISDTILAKRLRGRQIAQGADAFTRAADLKRLAQYIVNNEYRMLFIPANVDNNHWIIFHVDIPGRILSWGR